MITESPALRARELLSMTRIADAPAEHLAADTGDPLTARVVAHSLLAVQRSLVLLVREMVLAGELPTGVAEGVRSAGRGIGAYATRPAAVA
ncbi:hypothetical protein JIG36_34395 [Actinoplanes sp. LDG1-06]|uniref:Uncharacterized protein n=1 Tax=Paractinoplanes ovalisporus TaxID=2810368 RepID=A0ABS2ALA8_9ACTN|nr:hypothetical protein [Actinoplanes ovalisporus]MBM2620605.1 hypothetical protein [Actinoplanes ovalisporus]